MILGTQREDLKKARSTKKLFCSACHAALAPSYNEKVIQITTIYD